MTARKIQYWVIPPHKNGAFAAAMENILDTYSRLNYTHHTLKFSFFFQNMEVFCDSCAEFRKVPLSSAGKVAKMLDVTVCKDLFLEKLKQSFERIQIRRIRGKLELYSFYNEIRTCCL